MFEITNGNIKKFLEKISEDQELQAKFSKIRDPEEAYKLASSVQDGFTKEEFIAEMKKLYEEVTKDLSEEDMAKLAGGENWAENISQTWVSLTIIGAGSLGCITMAAYAAVT